MHKQRKIGWQKYEDVVQSEMFSPIANMFYESLSQGGGEEEEEELQESETFIIPKNFYETIALMSRFDCWIGHTNFNITSAIKNKLNEVDGIEVLNIISRYRFFVGIGKMFKFTDVRKEIEKAVLSKGEEIGHEIEQDT